MTNHSSEPEQTLMTWPPAPISDLSVTIHDGLLLTGSSAQDKRLGMVAAYVLVGLIAFGQSCWMRFQSGKLSFVGFDLSQLPMPQFFLVMFAPLLIGIVFLLGCLILFSVTSLYAAKSFRSSLPNAWSIASAIYLAYNDFS